MFNQVKGYVKGKTTMTFIIVIASIIISLACFVGSGKKDNIGTEIADDIIKAETGIDMDKILPNDKTSSTITP
jgi:hypothetical protein